MKPEEKEIQPCSEQFQDAICDSGGLVKTCELCDRVHFDTCHTEDYEKGEFIDLEEKQKINPDKYIGHDGTVSYGWVMGNQVVWGCPCEWKKARRIEDFMLNHREQIARYFKKMAEAATQQAKELERISKSI